MTYMYTPARHRRSGTTMQKSKPRGDMAKYVAARQVMPGFPASPFARPEDIEAYISGDTLTCLLCGKDYRGLLIHVRRLHQVEPTDYRMQFNIPTKYSLNGAATRERKRWLASQDENLEHIRRLGLAHAGRAPGTRRPLVRMVRDAAIRNLASAPPQARKDDGDYSWHLEQVRTVFRFSAVQVPKGLASWRTIKRRRAKSPELNSLFLTARAARLSALDTS